jgi:hypothetical protein
MMMLTGKKVRSSPKVLSRHAENIIAKGRLHESALRLTRDWVHKRPGLSSSLLEYFGGALRRFFLHWSHPDKNAQKNDRPSSNAKLENFNSALL